jgi:hypothetical protein
MRLRHDNTENPDPPGNPGEPNSNGGELRAQAEALLAAADDAINRALSQNSLEFLEQNRQSGGQ